MACGRGPPESPCAGLISTLDLRRPIHDHACFLFSSRQFVFFSSPFLPYLSTVFFLQPAPITTAPPCNLRAHRLTRPPSPPGTGVHLLDQISPSPALFSTNRRRPPNLAALACAHHCRRPPHLSALARMCSLLPPPSQSHRSCAHVLTAAALPISLLLLACAHRHRHYRHYTFLLQILAGAAIADDLICYNPSAMAACCCSLQVLRSPAASGSGSCYFGCKPWGTGARRCCHG